MDLPIFTILLAISVTRGNAGLDHLAMQDPDLFEGDILGMDDFEDRGDILHGAQIWPLQKVPYVIDSSLSEHRNVILQAMYQYHRLVCVRFVERHGESTYLRIYKGKGCYSYVGKTSGAQPLSLGDGCHTVGTIMHQLGHTLGMYHEHSRPDRDEYVVIHWDNIKKGMEAKFAKMLPEESHLPTDFDFDSIMLYGETTFSVDGEAKTMTARNGATLLEPCEKVTISDKDAFRINVLYSCPQIYAGRGPMDAGTPDL